MEQLEERRTRMFVCVLALTALIGYIWCPVFAVGTWWNEHVTWTIASWPGQMAALFVSVIVIDFWPVWAGVIAGFLASQVVRR